MAADQNDLIEFMVWLEHNYAIGFSGDDMLNIPRTFIANRPAPYEMPTARPAFHHEIDSMLRGPGSIQIYVCAFGMYLSNEELAKKHIWQGNRS